jgi:metal-sulfur cluster biosynthetic enzyme
MHEDEVIEALRTVNDPELGMSIVDLGLVYRAERTPDRISVALTMTTPTCPLSELMLEDARTALRDRFPDAGAIEVSLVWDPPWSPERMSETARRQLG